MDQPVAPGNVNDVDDAVAAGHIRNARRILVVGCSGGGKSTLSQKLARHFDLTYISIDRDILWLPGWVQRDRAEQRRRIVERIADDRWIMDGTNPSTFDVRVPRSDIVVWVRMPRLLCVWGVVTRWLKYLGRARRKWRRAASRRSIGSSSNSSGPSRTNSRRVSSQALPSTARMCRFCS